MNKTLNLIGRLLLAQIFILSAISKLGAGYAATQGYMDMMGVPGSLLPLVIALELGAGLALVLGWQTRWAAVLLAGFSVVAGLLFHNQFDDPMQRIMFMKNLALAGGLLVLAAAPTYGSLSLDARRSPHRNPDSQTQSRQTQSSMGG